MPADPFYTSPAWRTVRAQRLAHDNYQCFVRGCPVRANTVDHIKERLAFPGLALDPANLRSCCPGHHNQAHREKARGGGAREQRFTVHGCDADGWPIDPARR